MKPTSKEVINELCKILNATPKEIKEIKGFITPEEKAKDLIDIYSNILSYAEADKQELDESAKDCALIAVYMVIKCCEEYDEAHEAHTTQVDYWKEVKREIENL